MHLDNFSLWAAIFLSIVSWVTIFSQFLSHANKPHTSWMYQHTCCIDLGLLHLWCLAVWDSWTCGPAKASELLPYLMELLAIQIIETAIYDLFPEELFGAILIDSQHFFFGVCMGFYCCCVIVCLLMGCCCLFVFWVFVCLFWFIFVGVLCVFLFVVCCFVLVWFCIFFFPPPPQQYCRELAKSELGIFCWIFLLDLSATHA